MLGGEDRGQGRSEGQVDTVLCIHPSMDTGQDEGVGGNFSWREGGKTQTVYEQLELGGVAAGRLGTG